MAGLIVMHILALDVMCNNASRSQVFMTAAAMIHASRMNPKFDNEAFVGVSQSSDAVRPEFITGAAASPLAMYKADQLRGWPVCYYCIMLVPLDVKDKLISRAMRFCVGLYVTPKDGMVIAAAGTAEAGFGIISLLRAHESDANAYVNRKAPGAQKHLDHAAIGRWLTKLADITDKDSSAVHREMVIRDALAIDKKVKYPMVAFPRYRIVSCRVIVNIV
jgi:hypothetical protein